MCNLYSMTTGQQAIREAADVMSDLTGNLPPMDEIYPDRPAPVVRNTKEGRELALMRWGMPSPAFALKGKKTDRGVTNIRNTVSPHWRPWLGVSHRCLVPFTAFSEYGTKDGRKVPVWFALNENRPLAFFAGVWTNWTSTRKVSEGEVKADLFGFLTCEPNKVVAPIHPKAMPVILTRSEEFDLWMNGTTEDALSLQRPLDDDDLILIEDA